MASFVFQVGLSDGEQMPPPPESYPARHWCVEYSLTDVDSCQSHYIQRWHQAFGTWLYATTSRNHRTGLQTRRHPDNASTP